jgi:hypothetical protein
MLQIGENLKFRAEARHHSLAGRQRRMHLLDGDLLIEVAVGSVSKIDPPHASRSQRADHNVLADMAIPRKLRR